MTDWNIESGGISTPGGLKLSDLTDAVSNTTDIGVGEGALNSYLGLTSRNTAIGANALYSNTSGGYNAAVGNGSLYENISGSENTASGYYSLYKNIEGNSNTANGYRSLYANTTGVYNTAAGAQSLSYNVTGNYNTACGGQSLYFSFGSEYNTAIGYQALWLCTGSSNTCLGYKAGDNITLGSNNIIIGDNTDAPSATGDNQLNIGDAIYGDLANGYIGIGETTPTHLLHLSADDAWKPTDGVWDYSSDERLKEDIELADLDICYDVVKNLPLKYYKWRDEVFSIEQVRDRHKLGWVAQEVESIFPKAVKQKEFKYNEVYEDKIIPAKLDEEGNEILPERTEKELVSADIIPDCRTLNADQIYAVMFGAIQKLMAKVEKLENI